jgi:hypothetical protein
MAVVKAIARMKSVSPYSQSKVISEPKRDKETAKDHEERCWRSRCNATPDGHIFIPPMAFKNCITSAAKFLGMQIPGKARQTYTKHVQAGILVNEPLVLPEHVDSVVGEWLFVPSNGQVGGGSRVWKCFPVIPQWEGDVTFYVVDPAVTRDVFTEHLEEAGRFIGIGRFRPQNNGYYGRFEVVRVAWDVK